MQTVREAVASDPWSEVTRLRARNATLTATVASQQRTIAELTDECPPSAPSLAIAYWKLADARGGEQGWPLIARMLRPLLDDLGSLPAPLLTPMRWDEHRARRRLYVTRRGGPPRESCLNLELVYAKALLNFAVDRGMIKRNPLERARPVPTITARETRLTPEDVERLLEAADDVVNRRLREGDDDGSSARLLKAFILAKHDGMLRFTEARTLRLGRIQPNGEYKLLPSETKNKRERTVRLTPRALEAIAAIRRPRGAVYVFEDAKGLVSDNRLRDYFRRACVLSGVDARASLRDVRVRPHDLRASGATIADLKGARARAIQRTLGHASLRTTQIYLRSDDRIDAADVHDAIVAGTDRRPPKRAPRHNRHLPKRNM